MTAGVPAPRGRRFTTERLHGGVWAALRIAAGLAYFSHGAQKILGWFGGFGEAGTAQLMSEYGAAGMIELVGGALIVLGLFFVMVYSFLWLFFAAWGAGPFSLDAWRRRRATTVVGEP